MADCPPSPDIELIVSGGPAMETQSLVLDKLKSIGRSSENDVVLNDSSVSRVHATLDLDGQGIFIADKGSRGGVYLNRMRLEPDQRERLKNCDLLNIGPFRFLVRIPSEKDEEQDSEAPSAGSDTSWTEATTSAGRDDSLYATRESIFLRLRADGTLDRELGWNEFTEKYSPVIVGFTRNAGLKKQDADDILQDVLMGFFRVSSDFTYDPTRGRFRGYLKRVTLNAIRSRYRRRRPDRNIEPEWEPPALDRVTDDMWDRQWTEQLLHRAMEQSQAGVEERTWKAFELYGLRGMPVDSVAEETGMTPDAIRHAKMRITKQVRKIIDSMRSEEG